MRASYEAVGKKLSAGVTSLATGRKAPDVELCVVNPLLPKQPATKTEDLFPEIQPAEPLEAPRPAGVRGGRRRAAVCVALGASALLAAVLLAALWLHNGVSGRGASQAGQHVARGEAKPAGWRYAEWEEGRLGGRRLASIFPNGPTCPRYSVRTHAASTWTACNEMCSDMGDKCGDFRLDLVDHVCILQICGQADGSQSVYDYHDNLACRGNPVNVLPNYGLEACEDACDRDPTCRAYTYLKFVRECRLMPACEDRAVVVTGYSGISRAGGDEGLVSYIFRTSIACKDPHTVMRDVSLADCERQCTAAGKGCVALTYNARRQDCYLKASCNRIESERNDVTGVKVMQT